LSISKLKLSLLFLVFTLISCSSRDVSIKDISLRASRDAHQAINDKGGRGAIAEIIKCYKNEQSKNEFLYCFSFDTQVKLIDALIAEHVDREKSEFFNNETYLKRFAKIEKYYGKDDYSSFSSLKNDDLRQTFSQIEVWLAYGLQVESAKISGDNIDINTAEAEYFIGELYYDGEKVNKDSKKAFEWFLKSANNGDASAQVLIGMMYAEGNGTDKNLKESTKWFRKSAVQGNREAQAFLGQAYLYGDGVPMNYSEAEKWLTLAADGGFAYAQRDLGFLSLKTNTDESIRKAIKYFKMAAEQGEPESQFILGVAYKSGEGVDKDYQKAKKYLTEAKNKGIEKAGIELSELENN